MEDIANRILWIFIRLVKKEMSEYQEDKEKKKELYIRIRKLEERSD